MKRLLIRSVTVCGCRCRPGQRLRWELAVFVLDRSQRARVQKFPRVMAGVVVLALLTTTVEARQPAEAASPLADPVHVAQKVSSRPDLVSAVVTARSQGSKVEVESLRTENATTWVNPDGTMTTEAHAAPIRFKTPGGEWQSIDLTLQRGIDGFVAPRGHKLALRLGKRNATTGQVFAAVSAGTGRQVEWMAPWKLPEPSLDGTKATYADVQPGVDLKMDVRRSGFETDFIVKQRPTVAPVWRIPLRTKGLTPKALPDGSIDFLDAKNVVRSTIPVSYMWDSVTDPATGQPVHKTAVKVTVEQVSAGKATLVIAPDAQWFLDSARVFPVTVDPTYANTPVYSSFDTFVQSGFTSDLSTTVDLRVGKNGTTTERSFLNFAGTTFQGKDITSASLFLYQYGATTCTATPMNLHAALPASTSTRWTAQPVTSQQIWGSVSAAKGFSGACPGGRIAVPITELAKYWSGTTDTTVGVALKAANEADANAWKRFVSSEGDADPYISLTWNRAPGKPAAPTYTEAVAYAAPGATESWLYSPTLRPWVTTKANDPDLNTVKYVYEFHTTPVNSTSLKATCTSSVYASGTTAGCRPSIDLPDNTPIYVRAKANDGRIDGVWSNFVRVITGTQQPAQPVVTCPAPYSDGTWQDNAPTANVECVIAATGASYSAPGYVRVTVDGKLLPTNVVGGPPGQIKITPSSDPAIAKYSVSLPKDTPGLHTIAAQAETPAGKLSTTKTHNVGWGGTNLTSPAASPRVTTSGAVRITASGPPKGQSATPTARVRWRLSGYGGSQDTVGWNEDATPLPVVDKGAGGVSVDTLWDTNNAKIDTNLDADPSTPVIEPTTLNDRVPVLLDVQVCFVYGTASQCTWSQKPDTTVQRVPHAFGDGFPTAGAGSGEVALWTGEFTVSSTDVEVPGYADDLTLSRTHSTYAGPSDDVNGVFGPGWKAGFDGIADGVAGFEVVDSSRVDGSIALLSGDGTGLVYEAPNGLRRTGAAFQVGDWVPADEATDLDAGRLTVSGSGAATVLAYTEDDGTVTTFKVTAAPGAGVDAAFRVTGIAVPGVATDTTYSYDGSGRVARILAPSPAGVSCPATGALNPGCRALRMEYSSIGTPGIRLTGVWLDIYNPDKAGGAGMDSIRVGTYSYDSAGRLQKLTDPRSNLSTEYGYNAANHLTSIKPPGQVPVQLNYELVDGQERLLEVTRARPVNDPAGGTAVLARFVYDVPVSGAGLPDMTAASVGRWNQKSAPTKGFAVFGPEHPVTGTPTEGDWKYADLQYTDASGYTVNTAEFGANKWQYTAIDYNDQGNAVRELDARALRKVIDDPLPAGAAVDQLATLTIYNLDSKDATGEVLTPAGTLVTDTYEPSRQAVLRDGSVQWLRRHVRTKYDQEAPNNGINPSTTLPYRLETSEQASVSDPGTGADIEVIAGSLTRYSLAGEADGWDWGLVGESITDMDLDGSKSAGDQIHITRYDSEGRVIEGRAAGSASGNGSDAGTTKTVHYSAAPNSAFPACGGKPQWAGQVCTTYPGGSPVSAAGQPATPTIPTITVGSYNYMLNPTVTTETSGSVTRTTTLGYELDGRLKTSSTSVVGLPTSTPVTRKDTTYDPVTGLPTVAIALNADNSVAGTVTTGYDTWGRQVSYQPSGESATTTTYNAAGSVATVVDANGATTYTYAGADAAGGIETRQLPTKVEVTTAGGTWVSTAAYDSAGDMTLQRLPGGITAINQFDHVGEPVGLEYTGQVTTTNEDGSTTVQPDGSWLAWSMDNDVNGRLAREWTPSGAAFTEPANDTGPTDVGDAAPYDRAYFYDAAGRLTQVRDRTGVAGVDIEDPAQSACVTRTYSFDSNDNRLAKTTNTSGSTGACPTGGGTASNRAFDTADRPTSGANGQGTYVYDPLGRTLTMPGADAPTPQDGDVTFAYYDNDLAKSITQAGVTTSFTLDALDRRATETAVAGGITTQSVRHYTDESDNPTWVTQGTTTQRFTELIGGELALTVSQNGSGDLTLSNLHGDVVTTVDLSTASAVATAISGWNDYDEYGQQRQHTATTTPVKYGWLGARQRAHSGADLTLMGARLYNPATGLFTSMDPIPGGNANDYTYPTDPVNTFDLDGRMCRADQGGRSRGADFGGSRRVELRRPPTRTTVTSSSGGYRYGLRHLNRIQDRLERINRSRHATMQGKKGMNQAKVSQNTKKITIHGRTRIPDGRSGKDGRNIVEVKNYRVGRTLAATRQIRDFADWARLRGGTFTLKVNRGVNLSGPLKSLIQSGAIRLVRY
ncbi:DNRLRE domain-containing protein [Kribbella ginsengisoli]|uniref:Tox-REase-7 domain-containing protein n=1 Tax=Kribbella ginsengisoli TaxID=363865 RepID=A0ABP6VLI2_9ACTN